jgi:hypothetical protein
MDAKTFGDAPAAMYLVELLNKRNDPILTRKISKVLASGRETLNDLGNAHLKYDTISTRTFARMLTLLSEFNQAKAAHSIAAVDPFMAHLVVNILEGGVKCWKRRVQEAQRKQSNVARSTPAGCRVFQVPANPIDDEKDSLTLQERSKRYLQRKGKIDTLY